MTDHTARARDVTIGTAGHVDHGKSALVRALTGIDPDRLREEKERGLTIDLGFAWFTLPGGEEVSIVDVPGHERFIKNMLAGVGGIDLALLVIAADEGVMPQTREHLAIIDLLGIANGVVAVTKADLVEPDFLELVKAEAEEAIAGTTLEGATVVACSAVTRAGLDELTGALDRELAKAPARRDTGRPRLPIDRAFTMSGFGTVVTGTLMDGPLSVGQDVEVLPAKLRARVRGLQTHGRKVDEAPPGRRTAVNLTGLAVDQLERGMVVTTPGWLKPVTTARRPSACRPLHGAANPAQPLGDVPHRRRRRSRASCCCSTATGCRPERRRGHRSGWPEPVAAIKGDRFVIRDPNDTLGGGVIVDVDVTRHRRHHAPTIAALEAMEKGSPEELVLIAISRLQPIDQEKLSQTVQLDTNTVGRTLETLIRQGSVLALDMGPAGRSGLYTTEGIDALGDRIKESLKQYHQKWPLRTGIPREELRTRFRLGSRRWDEISRLLALDELKDVAGRIALPDHEAHLTPPQEAVARAFVEALRANAYSPPEASLDDELLAYLEARARSSACRTASRLPPRPTARWSSE